MAIERVTKGSSAYDALRCMGVICGQFSGGIHSIYGWTMEFFAVGIVPEEAKNAATIYLRREYDATDIEFFKRKGDISTKFYARFTRGDI